MFSILSQFVGSLQQKYASVSFVMAEALRFKRVELYKLLDEWRSCLKLPPASSMQTNGNSHEHRSPRLLNGLS